MRSLHHLRVGGFGVLCLVMAATVGYAQNPSSRKELQQDGFHIVLLLAQAKPDPAAAAAELPPGVAKALKDASEFLPFKYFTVWDQAVLHGAATEQSIRLRGLGGRQYLASLTSGPTYPVSADQLYVKVHLTESILTATGSAQQAEVLTTGFPVRLGETVVVGTSRVTGDEAIVLLLTPLAPRKQDAPPTAPGTDRQH